MDTDLEDELKVSLCVNEKLRARIAELEAALAPFVDAAHFKITACTGSVIEKSVWNICVSEADLRAARAALEKK